MNITPDIAEKLLQLSNERLVLLQDKVKAEESFKGFQSLIDEIDKKMHQILGIESLVKKERKYSPDIKIKQKQVVEFALSKEDKTITVQEIVNRFQATPTCASVWFSSAVKRGKFERLGSGIYRFIG